MIFGIETTALAASGQVIDGLLGWGILSHYDIDIDSAKKTIRLYSAFGDCSTPHAAIDPPIYRAEFRPSRSELAVKIRVNDIGLLAQIDTGGPGSFIFANGLRKLGMDDRLAADPHP